MNSINFNYFFTPVGPEYKKTFARNFGIAILILFSFYGIWSLVTVVQEPTISSKNENTCDPGPVLENDYCYRDGKKIVFESETESKEIECLRLYRDIIEISRIDGMALAERETIKQQKEQLIQYVENDCPDFIDLDFMYNNYIKTESELEIKEQQPAINSKNKLTTPNPELKYFKNELIVEAFYSQYDDVTTSEREDRLSFAAGNGNDFLVRMNLYFDDSYELTHKRLYCYNGGVFQYEIAQEDILNYLQNYHCMTYRTEK